MRPTEQLKNEHEAIKLMMAVLEKICAKLEAKEKVPLDHLSGVVEFIKVFADKCHHAKEEDLLFVAMEEAGIPREGGPTGVMLMEHVMGRGYVRELAEAIEKYKAGDPGASLKIIESARNYINLLTPHIDKENSILYEIADMHLSEEKQKELSEKFETLENEKIGAGKHEEFHKLLENLRIYYIETNKNELETN